MADTEPHGWTRPELGELSPDSRHYWDGDIWGWQPLWLGPDEVVDVTRQCFEQTRTATTARFLAAGLLNQSWRIETRYGAYVLRVSRAERSVEQIAYEHAFARELHTHIGAVVAPLSGRDGVTIQRWRGRALSLYPFVAGQAGTSIAADDRGQQTATMLARIHRASLAHIHLGQRPGFRAVDEHPRWIWASIEPALTRALGCTDGYRRVVQAIEREMAELDVWLDTLHAAKRPLPRATVHGDFNPRNLIFSDTDLIAVVDWDECRIEPIAWEVAQVGFGAADIDPPTFWATYLDAGGPLAPEDVDLLAGFARMGALSELQWTTNDGAAAPHAIQQLRDVVSGLAWLRTRSTHKGSEGGRNDENSFAPLSASDPP